MDVARNYDKNENNKRRGQRDGIGVFQPRDNPIPKDLANITSI